MHYENDKNKVKKASSLTEKLTRQNRNDDFSFPGTQIRSPHNTFQTLSVARINRCLAVSSLAEHVLRHGVPPLVSRGRTRRRARGRCSREMLGRACPAQPSCWARNARGGKGLPFSFRNLVMNFLGGITPTFFFWVAMLWNRSAKQVRRLSFLLGWLLYARTFSRNGRQK